MHCCKGYLRRRKCPNVNVLDTVYSDGDYLPANAVATQHINKT